MEENEGKDLLEKTVQKHLEKTRTKLSEIGIDRRAKSDVLLD